MAGLVQKFKQMWTPPEDEYDYDFEEMDMDDEEVMDKSLPAAMRRKKLIRSLRENPDGAALLSLAIRL